MSTGRLLVALLLGSLAGCHLLDQTDFDPMPPAPPPPPKAAADPETRPALVTIEYTRPNPDYRAALTEAVKAVEARRPGSFYDVVAVIAGPTDAEPARARAAEVMTAIEAQGVIPTRIQLGLKIEPGRSVRQVRVYLR